MDNLQPPDALKELWLGGEERKENIDMIVAATLKGARNYRQGAQKLDTVVILLCVICIVALMALYNGLLTYLAQAAYAVWCAIALYAYRRFYRVCGEEPTPGSPAREYAGAYIHYLERRSEFLKWGMRCCWPVPLSGLFAAAAGVQNDELVLGFGWLAICLSIVPVSWWMTRVETRRIADRIDALRRIAQEGDL
jgi:Ca2+/Na+ antiporter